MEKLGVGDKYLTISLFGKDGIRIAAFPNKNKQKPTDADYLGNGVAVWVNIKKAPGMAQNASKEA